MSELVHDLPIGVLEWIQGLVGGKVTRLDRQLARREAWIVDVTRDGTLVEGFLRLQRDPGHDDRYLERETRITEALSKAGIPVAPVLGWNSQLRAALFGRDSGRADIDKLDDPRRQRAIMEDFIRVIARMHTLDLDALGLDDIMPPRPKTSAEAVLGEVDAVVRKWGRFLEGYVEPLITYGLNWLRRFAPEAVPRVSLVQGDTGPGNFMFQGDRVSAIIDLELGHWGDPMEDVGNIRVREFFNPCGGIEGLFESWSRESGLPYSTFGAQYYSVHQNVRGMVAIHDACNQPDPRESLATYLCYRSVGDRATCEAIAEAMGIDIERPEMPEAAGDDDVLAASALHALEHDVATGLHDAFSASRANDVQVLIACMDRRRRFGAAIAEVEREELGELLGRRPTTLQEGLVSLEAATRDRRIPDTPLVRYLARRAYRDEWVHAPAVAPYPERHWSAAD